MKRALRSLLCWMLLLAFAAPHLLGHVHGHEASRCQFHDVTASLSQGDPVDSPEPDEPALGSACGLCRLLREELGVVAQGTSPVLEPPLEAAAPPDEPERARSSAGRALRHSRAPPHPTL